MSEDTPGVDPFAVRAMESQSRDKLAVARHLHEQGNYDDAVSRAYYAVFHAATLLRQGADYDIYHAVDQEESKVAVDRAAKFVDTVVSVGRARYPEAFAHQD